MSSSDFSRALEDSLRIAGLLASTKEASRYAISAHLNALDQPLFGLDMTVTATVSYILTEKANGTEVHRATIVAPFTAKFSDALIAIERLKLANEGAVKENLTKEIEQLYSLGPGSVSVELAPPAVPVPKSKDARLQEAKAMFDKGLINRDIYIDQQKRILNSL